MDLLALKEFSILQTTEEGRQHYTVTQQMLGVYCPSEHIDNPVTLDPEAIDPRTIDKDFEPLIRPGDPLTEVDPQRSMKRYIFTAEDYMRQKLTRATAAGPTPEGMRYFGEALHVLEDFFAHSNFAELSLRKIGHHQVLPWTTLQDCKHGLPVITGLFSGSDVLASVLEPLAKILFPTDGLKITLSKPGERSDTERMLEILLKEDESRLWHTALTSYPTSRPYLHQAPRDGAPLDIVIIEGFVESIELAGSELPLSLRGAFPDVLGHPLYLPDLEQGLDQLNRLRAYDLGIDLLPGQMPGGTRVQVVPHKQASRWHLDSHFDNRGSELTGRHRLTLGLGLDSPLGLNDDLRLSLVSTVIDAPGQSQGVNLHYSAPYGPWTFALNASELRYGASIPHSPHIAGGSSSYRGLNIERTLWRNQRGMLSVSGRLNRKQLINRSNGSVVAFQSPTLSTVEAGVNLLWLDHGLWNAYLGMTQGVDWFGADRSALRADAPSPDFRKYRVNLFHLRQGPAHWPWRWQNELNLQYSDDVLPAVEQFLLNDDSAVRGFRRATFAGANAALWRNTFSQALPMDWTGPVQVRPYLGLDLGWVQLAHDAPSHRLAGAAAGVELSVPNCRLRLDYQHALYASNLPRSRREQGFWVLEWSLNI